jgi:hypothetical protein
MPQPFAISHGHQRVRACRPYFTLPRRRCDGCHPTPEDLDARTVHVYPDDDPAVRAPPATARRARVSGITGHHERAGSLAALRTLAQNSLKHPLTLPLCICVQQRRTRGCQRELAARSSRRERRLPGRSPARRQRRCRACRTICGHCLRRARISRAAARRRTHSESRCTPSAPIQFLLPDLTHTEL